MAKRQKVEDVTYRGTKSWKAVMALQMLPDKLKRKQMEAIVEVRMKELRKRVEPQ